MPSNPRIAALPAVRAEAERLAAELLDAVPDDGSDPQEGIGLSTVERGMLALLSDLSRPASRDAVARLVAEAVGLQCVATAPELRLEESYWEGDRTHSWLLVVAVAPSFGRRRWWSFHSEHEDPDGADGWALVPGISAITDPAEALTLIALAVLGGPDAR